MAVWMQPKLQPRTALTGQGSRWHPLRWQGLFYTCLILSYSVLFCLILSYAVLVLSYAKLNAVLCAYIRQQGLASYVSST
jgi:hypothetical protein